MSKTPPKSALHSKKYVIAAYLRISREDESKDESSSIQNQRNIIKNYVAEQKEFQDAAIIDYVDDGISGSHTERESYQRLLEDIGRGDVDCIIVKDISRIGRNMIDVGDLLMNYLVMLNIRFIAIGNNYDSLVNPLTNLELAMINLANQYYNRDLAQKIISVRRAKNQRGEYLAIAPFGYKKSKTARNKLEPDEESAGYIRLIFSLAVEGRRSVEIAQILNEQGIPTPLDYKIKRGGKKYRKVIDLEESFWTNRIVRRIVINEVYMGTVTACKSKLIEPGKRRKVELPREEWIIVPNTHEPLVSEDDFRKAQLILQRIKYPDEPGHIFWSKVRCPACGYAMARSSKKNPRFKCETVKFINRYGCGTYVILQSELVKSVLSSIRSYAAVLIDQEELSHVVLEQEKATVKGLEKKILDENKAIQVMETSVKKLFTSFISDSITKEDFQKRKSIICDAITRKRKAIDLMEEQMESIAAKRARANKIVTELSPMLTLETLDRELVDLLIEKILVHSEKDIEIVWKEM